MTTDNTPPVDTPVDTPVETRYYHAFGQGHDDILRCKDCRRLFTTAQRQKAHACPHCGNRRYSEVVTLSVWEWLQIRCGILRFPHRKAFLAEFSRG